MKRFWIGVGLLGVLLVAGIWVMVATNRIQMPISDLLAEAAEECLEGDFTEGIQLARQAQLQWRQHWQAIAAGANHQPMDEIDGLFAQMEVYARERQTMAFASCCARLSELVEAMGESHSLKWWNLL